MTMGCGSPQISGVMGLTTVMTTVMRGIAVSYHSDIKEDFYLGFIHEEFHRTRTIF